MPTLTDLGRLVKTRYPGKYDDVPDDQLGREVQSKFPGEFDEYSEGMSPLEADTYLGKLARGPQPLHPAPTPAPQPSLDRIDAAPRVPVGSEKLGGPPPIAPPPFAGSDREPFRRGFMQPPVITQNMPPGLEGMQTAGEGVRQILNAERQTIPQRAPGPMPSRMNVLGRFGGEIAGGLSKMIRGGMGMAEQPLLPIMAANPVRAALGIGTGMLAQTGVEAGARKLGVPEGYSQLAGDVAGLGVGTFAATRPSPFRPKPNATPPIGDSAPPEAPSLEPVPKGPKSAQESAEVFAREFPPPFKSAEDSARVLAWNIPPETRPSSFAPAEPIPPSGGGPNPPVGAVARMRQETAVGPTAEALPERLMGQTPLQAKVRREVGDAYASIVPSRIMNAAERPGLKVRTRKGAITLTRDDVQKLRGTILGARPDERGFSAEELNRIFTPGNSVLVGSNRRVFAGPTHDAAAVAAGAARGWDAMGQGFIRVRPATDRLLAIEFIDSPKTRPVVEEILQSAGPDQQVYLDVRRPDRAFIGGRLFSSKVFETPSQALEHLDSLTDQSIRTARKGAITVSSEDLARARKVLLPGRATDLERAKPVGWKDPLRNGEDMVAKGGGIVRRNDADVLPLYGMQSPSGSMYTGRLHDDISFALGLPNKEAALTSGFIRVANHERGMRTRNSTLEFVDTPETRRRAIDLLREYPEENYVTLDIWNKGPNGWEKTDLSRFYNSAPEAIRALAQSAEKPLTMRAGQRGAITIGKEDIERVRGALLPKGRVLPAGPEAKQITPGLLDTILDTHNESGGSTFSLISGESQAGKNLWAYSPVKNLERQIPRDLTTQDLQDYISQPEVSKLLNDPSGKYHLGTWKSGDTNFLDVSVLESDKLASLRGAKKANQLAIFNLGSFEELPTTKGIIQAGLENFANRVREAVSPKARRGSFPVDTKDRNDLAIWGAAMFLRGIKDPVAWKKEMVGQFGQSIAPTLDKIFKRAQWNFDRWVEKNANLPNTKKLLELYEAGKEGQDWYPKSAEEIKKVFGDDAPMFMKFLAATSPQQSVEGNISLATKAYVQWKTSGKFDRRDYLGSVRKMLERIAAGQEKFTVRGPKVDSFTKNLLGDVDAVTVDRWIARAFGFEGKEFPYKFIDYAITQVAEQRGVEPRQLQASIWKAMKDTAREAGEADWTAEDFGSIFRRRLSEQDPDLVEALRLVAKPKPALKARSASEAGFLRFGDIRESSRKAEREILDRFSDIRHFTSRANLPREQDPYIAARLYAGRGGRVINRLQNLSRNILRPAYKEKLLEPMKQLALYERYEELASRGITEFPDGITLPEIQTRKAALENRLGPAKLARVRDFISRYRTFMNGTLRELKDAEVISTEAYNKILSTNEHYIPLERVSRLDETMDHIPIGGEIFSVPAQHIIQRIQGSEKALVDPIESSIKRVFQSVSIIGRNRAALQMANLSTDPRFTGQVIKLNPSQPPPSGMGTFAALRNGHKELYAVPKPVADAMHHLHYQEVDLVTRMAQKTGSWLRAGATSLNMAFIPPNVIRDVQTATLVSEVGFTPFDFLRGFLESIKQGSDYRSYLESGAAFSGMMEGYRNIPAAAKDLTGQMTLKKAFNAVNPLEYIRKMGEISEQSTRLGVYKRALRKGQSETSSAFISRNATVDFSKAGSTMRVMNLWVPFLNARTQGTLNVFGTAKNRPIRSGLVLGTMVAVPVVATYLHNSRQFPKVWDSIAQFEKDNNFIVIYGDEVDADGNPTQVVKIPKGDVGRIFGNPIENYLSWKDNKDAKSLGTLALQMGSDISPVSFEKEGKASATALLSSTLPPAAKAGVEWATNKNLYTGRDIVPESLQKASPGEQYRSNTSPAMVKLGKALGVSPMKLQNVAGTMFGGLGRQVVSPTTASQQVMRRFSGAFGKAEVNRKFDRLNAIEQGRTDRRVRENRDIDQFFQTYRTAPAGQRQALIRARLPKMTESEAERFLGLLNAHEKGLDPFERTLSRAPIETRAKFMAEELKKATPSQRRALFQGWIQKGILTDRVAEEMVNLKP